MALATVKLNIGGGKILAKEKRGSRRFTTEHTEITEGWKINFSVPSVISVVKTSLSYIRKDGGHVGPPLRQINLDAGLRRHDGLSLHMMARAINPPR